MREPTDDLSDIPDTGDADIERALLRSSGVTIERPPATGRGVAPPAPAAEASQDTTAAPGPQEQDQQRAASAEALRSRLRLPSEQEKKSLKGRYPGHTLTVVPIPVGEDSTGKYKAYIVRSVTRSEWSALGKMATDIATKTDRNPDDVFAGKIVVAGTVWPRLDEQGLLSDKAGLVPTLFEMIKVQSWFLDTDALLSLTFPL